MERVRAMIGISFYLYEMGSARAPKGFPWWTAGMKIDPRVPNTAFWLPPPQFGSIFGSSRTKPSFWILKALPPRSPDQVLWRELRSMEALGEIKRK